MDQSPEIKPCPRRERGSESTPRRTGKPWHNVFPTSSSGFAPKNAPKTVEVRKSGANYWLVT